ncbi:hypothetical protein [Streptomyces sp. H39-C1]|uniref:hypothetical protein n=1 Tax=Streptomyces sp. H39-C1 TaxID=3004355 RepID=UPI0022AF0B1D|nr:hypothetical protein [Streptomyces sp. H39-C1]MCZ4101792.1 hypothetical protein [Streptomyces sp. H39-C1]
MPALRLWPAGVRGVLEEVHGVDEVIGGERGEGCELHRAVHGSSNTRGEVEPRHGAQRVGQVEGFAGQGLGGGDVAREVAGRVWAAQESEVVSAYARLCSGGYT